MRISRTVAELPNIEDAALMMGTPSNKQIMRDAGLLTDDGEAAVGGDLIPGVRGVNTAATNAAIAAAAELLDAPKRSADDRTVWPRSLRAAVAAKPTEILQSSRSLGTSPRPRPAKRLNMASML